MTTVIKNSKETTMNTKDSVVFITGANRGLGLQLAKAALAAQKKGVSLNQWAEEVLAKAVG